MVRIRRSFRSFLLQMLSITAKSPYAVQALTELGRAGGVTTPVPVAELARRREIPGQFLEQLFATLRRAGLLRSQRGVHGGYVLTRDAREITVLEVVEMLDGPLGQDSTGVFAEVAAAAREVLAGTTIQDVIDREAREQGETMYWI